jgi:chromosome segregation ATPase
MENFPQAMNKLATARALQSASSYLSIASKLLAKDGNLNTVQQTKELEQIREQLQRILEMQFQISDQKQGQKAQDHKRQPEQEQKELQEEQKKMQEEQRKMQEERKNMHDQLDALKTEMWKHNLDLGRLEDFEDSTLNRLGGLEDRVSTLETRIGLETKEDVSRLYK